MRTFADDSQGKGVPKIAQGFAVIDFETTGLFPGGHDRVIEIGIVHTDAHGSVTGQWETLVNPNWDLGRQDIHRIHAADILEAPTFEQIVPSSSSSCAIG